MGALSRRNERRESVCAKCMHAHEISGAARQRRRDGTRARGAPAALPGVHPRGEAVELAAHHAEVVSHLRATRAHFADGPPLPSLADGARAREGACERRNALGRRALAADGRAAYMSGQRARERS